MILECILAVKWYKITIKKGMFNESDPVASLDAAILQEHLLYPVWELKIRAWMTASNLSAA